MAEQELPDRALPAGASGTGTAPAADTAAAWLLTPDERGNPATAIDLERGDGRAWTAGNRVTVNVDGAAYFGRLHQLLSGLSAGDWVYLTDWRIDATRLLAARAASSVRCWPPSPAAGWPSGGCCGAPTRPWSASTRTPTGC
jgi:hypothetical protein